MGARRRQLKGFAILLGLVTIAIGAVRADEPEAKPRAPKLELWREILQARVNPRGEVAYRTLREHDAERMDRFIESFARVDLDRLDGPETVAFWINAYNAGVVAGVLHGERPETIRGRARLYAWRAIEVGGKRRTLDSIQGELARYAAVDPRIHLALCNGARSAPAIAREPYVAESLDEQLARAAREFVRDPERNRVAGENRALSSLFAWYRDDFSKTNGWLGAWLAPYLDEPERDAWASAETGAPAFLDFDWRLNAAPDEDPAKEPPAPASTAKR